MGKRSIVTAAIQATGLTLEEFCQEKLGLKYQNFRNRLKNGGLRLEDYHKLLFYTGKSFDELFPNPLQPQKPEKLPLVLGSRTLPPLTSLSGGVSGRMAVEDLEREILGQGATIKPSQQATITLAPTQEPPEAKAKGPDDQQRTPASKPYVFQLEDPFDELPGATPTSNALVSTPDGTRLASSLPPAQDDV